MIVMNILRPRSAAKNIMMSVFRFSNVSRVALSVCSFTLHFIEKWTMAKMCKCVLIYRRSGGKVLKPYGQIL